jgi:hypothetical protein
MLARHVVNRLLPSGIVLCAMLVEQFNICGSVALCSSKTSGRFKAAFDERFGREWV